jgi:hypothetical protein
MTNYSYEDVDKAERAREVDALRIMAINSRTTIKDIASDMQIWLDIGNNESVPEIIETVQFVTASLPRLTKAAEDLASATSALRALGEEEP